MNRRSESWTLVCGSLGSDVKCRSGSSFWQKHWILSSPALLRTHTSPPTMSEYRNFVLIVRNITQCLETDDVKQGFNSVPQRNLNNSLNQHNQRRIQSSECVKAGSSSPYTNICNEERSWRGANLTTQQAAEKNHSYKHKVKHSWTASVWVKKKYCVLKILQSLYLLWLLRV